MIDQLTYVSHGDFPLRKLQHFTRSAASPSPHIHDSAPRSYWKRLELGIAAAVRRRPQSISGVMCLFFLELQWCLELYDILRYISYNIVLLYVVKNRSVKLGMRV